MAAAVSLTIRTYHNKSRRGSGVQEILIRSHRFGRGIETIRLSRSCRVKHFIVNVLPGKAMTENEQILALEEIKKLKARYFRCLDTKDWAGYLDVFTPDAIIDSTEAYTPKDLNGAPIVFDGTVPPPPNPEWHSRGDPATFAKDLANTLDGVQTTHH